MSEPQSLKNHGRIDPSYHFVLFALVLAAVVIAGYELAHNFGWISGWMVIISAALLLAIFKIRLYSLKVQDRVIRLEERLRLQRLAPADFQGQIDSLTEDQLCGLRFASDGEVVALARKALAESLSRKQIKQSIQTWRPDDWRV